MDRALSSSGSRKNRLPNSRTTCNIIYIACGDKIEYGNDIYECMVGLYALKLTEDPHPAVPYRFRSQQ